MEGSRFAIHLQGTPPRTRTLTNWVGTSHAAITPGTRISQRKARTRTPIGSRRRLFSRQAPHSAGCLPLANKLRGLESNQRPPGSEPGVTTSSNYPGSSFLRDTLKSRQARGEGFEPSPPASKAGRLPLADPRSQGVPCGSRTHLASLEGWNLCRSAKGT